MNELIPKSDLLPYTNFERLAQSFWDVHAFEYNQAFFWAIESEGGNDFDFSSKYLQIRLRPRLGSDGNPSLLFTIGDAKFASFADILPGSPDARALEICQSTARSNEEMKRKTRPGFIGQLMVLWDLPGCSLWTLAPRDKYQPPKNDSEVETRKLTCRDWLPRFQFMVQHGFVMRRVPPEIKAMGHALGKLKLEKGNGTEKWVWKEVPDDLLKKMGCSDVFVESVYMHFW